MSFTVFFLYKIYSFASPYHRNKQCPQYLLRRQKIQVRLSPLSRGTLVTCNWSDYTRYDSVWLARVQHKFITGARSKHNNHYE